MYLLGRKSVVCLAAAILGTTCLAFGAWGHKSSDRTADITFSSTTKFTNGETLPAGTYDMRVPKDTTSPKVTFSQDGKVVATVNAQVVTQPKKNDTTEVDSTTDGNAQKVTAIRPNGWEEELVFGSKAQ